MGKKWMIRKVSARSVEVSDGWLVYHMLVYDDKSWGWDFPERVPKYVKKAAYRAVTDFA